MNLRRKFNGAKHGTEAADRVQMTDDRQGISSFEDLAVFQKAYRLSLEIHRCSLEFPPHEQYGFAEQLRKASKSICANLAEGHGKQGHSAKEFRRYIAIALGSSDEMRVWLRYCLDLGYINETEWQHWSTSYREISRMLQGLYRSWK
jgi:four helix bundle protein